MIKINLFFSSNYFLKKIIKLLYFWNNFYIFTLKHLYKNHTIIKSPKCHKVGKTLYKFSYPLINLKSNFKIYKYKILYQFYIINFLFFLLFTLNFNLNICRLTFLETSVLDI